MPSRTPSNGLETANQKQKSQGDTLALGSVFIPFSQVFEDRHFTKPCLPHTPFLTGTRVLLAVSSMLACAAESKSVLIVACLPADNGTSSKRNFHRPESNCGFPLNSACEVFIMLPSRLRLRIRLPTAMNRVMPQTKRNVPVLVQESDFSSCYFSQASEDRYFT